MSCNPAGPDLARNSMPLFRIRFKWKEKEYALKGRDLDMTHPYFVSLGDLIFPDSSALIIDPADDDIRREFSGVKHSSHRSFYRSSQNGDERKSYCNFYCWHHRTS